MSFIYVQYKGRKPYRDATPLRQTWQPGDHKLVSGNDATRLLKFSEFAIWCKLEPEIDPALVQSDPALTLQTPENLDLQVAIQQQEAVAFQQEQKRQAHENLLMEVDLMDKGALEAFAKEQFAVDLDRRLSVEKMRKKVSDLVVHGSVS